MQGALGRRAAALLSGFALLLASCVPAETRPEPGVLTVLVRGDAALAAGIDAAGTADGWAITWDRFLISLGNAELEEGDGRCQSYFGGGYTRVLALEGTGAENAQKLSMLHGLGDCDFGLRARNPQWDALLGAGVAEDEKALMRVPASDAYENGRGITAWVRGRAVRAGVEKRFDWAFRRAFDYRRCEVVTDAGVERGVSLVGGSEAVVEVRLRGAALFADAADDAAALRFEAFARADDEGDGDGRVDLDELAAIPIGEAVAPGAAVDPAWAHLRDWLYLGRFPALLRYRDTGSCVVEVDEDDD